MHKNMYVYLYIFICIYIYMYTRCSVGPKGPTPRDTPTLRASELYQTAALKTQTSELKLSDLRAKSPQTSEPQPSVGGDFRTEALSSQLGETSELKPSALRTRIPGSWIHGS